MATAPLFIADLATLKKLVRLSGINKKEDIETMLDSTIRTVRAGFYRKLGLTRITELVALSYTETPTTADHYMRSVANDTEVLWVRTELMKVMPMLFQDASGGADQSWNEEATFRDMGSFDISREINRNTNEIETNIEFLASRQSATNESPARFLVIEPDADMASPKPGSSINVS